MARVSAGSGGEILVGLSALAELARVWAWQRGELERQEGLREGKFGDQMAGGNGISRRRGNGSRPAAAEAAGGAALNSVTGEGE